MIVGELGGAGAGIAVVSGRGHHDDSSVVRLLDRVAQRVGSERVEQRRVQAVRKVENPDVESRVLRVLRHPVDGRNDLRRIDRTGGVAGTYADDSGARRNAGEVVRVLPAVRTIGLRRVGGQVVSVADHDAREVRAVAVAVDVRVGALRVEREVGTVHDVAALETRHRRNSGVDQRDVDRLVRRLVEAEVTLVVVALRANRPRDAVDGVRIVLDVGLGELAFVARVGRVRGIGERVRVGRTRLTDRKRRVLVRRARARHSRPGDDAGGCERRDRDAGNEVPLPCRQTATGSMRVDRVLLHTEGVTASPVSSLTH